MKFDTQQEDNIWRLKIGSDADIVIVILVSLFNFLLFVENDSWSLKNGAWFPRYLDDQEPLFLNKWLPVLTCLFRGLYKIKVFWAAVGIGGGFPATT